MSTVDHHAKYADKLEHARFGVTATRHGSNTTEGSGHEADGVPARFGMTTTRHGSNTTEGSGHEADGVPARFGMTTTRHGSNTTEGSGHETDGTPRRTRPSLERVYYCYVLLTC